MSWIEPLALQEWFVNTLAGGIEIFTFLAFIAISAMAAKFQMPNMVTLIMFILFAAIMNFYLNLGGLYILMILVAGLVTFYSFSKLWD